MKKKDIVEDLKKKAKLYRTELDILNAQRVKVERHLGNISGMLKAESIARLTIEEGIVLFEEDKFLIITDVNPKKNQIKYDALLVDNMHLTLHKNFETTFNSMYKCKNVTEELSSDILRVYGSLESDKLILNECIHACC